jgi:hypothetical protein
MAHAVEVFFDATTEATIRAVWARLEAAGVPSLATRRHRRHRPHISLSVAERIETEQIEDVRKRLAAAHLDVTLYSPAVFPRRGVLYLTRAQIAQGIDLLHDQPIITAHVSSAGILDTATGEVLPLAALRSHR